MDETGKPLKSLPKIPYAGEKHAAYKRALETRSPEDICKYAKGWGTRVKVNLEKLKEAIRLNEPQLSTIESTSLQNFDPNNTCFIGDAKFTLHDVIVQVYESFLEVGESRRGHTLISHILNVLAPDLLPHWDDAIREAYGCYENAEGYCDFIIRMRFEIVELVDSYRWDYPCETLQEAVEKIREAFYSRGWMPITRLIDMYNWWKYTRKKIDC